MSELTPPTTAVPLSSLLLRTDLGLRQVAGPPADEVSVYWVHTSEMADPVPYLLGGELLLTAGVHFAGNEAAGEPGGGAAGGSAADGAGTGDSGGYLEHYVARTVEAGAAALGFGLAPVHDTTPPALVAACDRYGLPLVEVPPRTPFTAIARAVWQAMAEARHRELRRITEAQQGLASAAARPDPVPAVLRQLAHHLDARAALLDPRGAELYVAGHSVTAEVHTALTALAAVVRPDRTGAPASATDTVGGTRLAAYALAGGGPGEGSPVLVLAAERRDFREQAIAAMAAVLLSLLTGPYRGAGDERRTAALVRLLLGGSPDEVAPLLATASAADGTDPHWTVVHARRRGAAPIASPPHGAERRREAELRDALAAGELAAALGTPLVDADGGTLRALLPAGREVTARPGWTLGVSEPVPAGGLPTADAQAAAALRRAVANRAGLDRHRSPRAGFAALVAEEEARAYAVARLAPIADSAALTGTLRTWLSLHGSWDRTAVALGVHRNTVRQRIARACALLDADLDDAEVRADLWFALRYV
ncbi:PucR family transcriptional regulator [Streptantibioticus ferralitis]|uniref:PucR family transcriptional regulator n=1 Tax=Streptantibioticus ferralitis TaxID=236510 RepID=A0ABT5YX55_9ACTN|nr:PucR family transcriptional regulator [Streptantibioticus ferralitis]MDF2255420.1 PucR family transcriptional regulator [Streptantibioticus ferralitis]